MLIKSIVIATTLVIGSAAAFAQAASTSPANSTSATNVDQREVNQGDRIADGVKKGELTPSQARRLAKQQRKIDKAQAKAKADGVVTPEEQAKLTKMQDRADANIVKDEKTGAALNR